MELFDILFGLINAVAQIIVYGVALLATMVLGFAFMSALTAVCAYMHSLKLARRKQ